MFLRRGRFRGRERDGNDRGGSQRRFERRGSAPASIEHGAAPGVSSAEDGYATNPRDSFHAAPPCSRRTTPSHWEGTSECRRRGVSRIFALSVQELNSRSPVDLMSQYGRGDCVSSCSVKSLGEVSGPQSSPVGLTGCEPPEQPDWGASFRRQHCHKPASCADDKGLGPGHLQRLDNRADCVDRSEKRFTGYRELSTHNSQGASVQAVNDKTCRLRNVHSRQIPLDGKGSSNHPASSTRKRGALNNQRNEIDNQAPTWKPALRQRDICQSKPDQNAESSMAKCNVSVSRQQGSGCDSLEGATVSSYLPPIGHRTDRKKPRKKRHGSKSKKRISSESEHNTSAENLGSKELVVDPKIKTADGRRRQSSSGHETSVEYLDGRERIVDPKIKTGDAQRQHTNSEHDANAENVNNRERVVDPTENVGVVRRRQNNLVDDKTVDYQSSRERVVDFGKKTRGARRGQNNSEHDIHAENLGSREKIGDPKMTTGNGQRRQANSEDGTQFERFVSTDKIAEPKQKPGGGRRRQISLGHGTHVDNLGSKERIVDHELEICSERRRQNNTEQGPFAANLSSQERVVDCKEKAGTGRGRQDNSEHGTHASKRGRRGRVFDPKVNHGGGQRKQTNSEHGTNADNLATRERVVDPKEKTDDGQRRQVRSDHERNAEILGSRERVGDPKMKTGFGQRRPTGSEHRRRVEKLNSGDRVVDPKKKAGDARGRHANLHHRTAIADMSSSEQVVEPNGMERKQMHPAHGAHAEVCPKDSLVDPKKEVQRKKGSSTNAARHELGQYERLMRWQTEPEDEDDWNMDHYGLSDMSPLTTALPVTLERPLVCGSDDTVMLCQDKDNGERSHVTVCDVDTVTDVISHETSHKYHCNDSDSTSSHNTVTSVCPQVVTVADRHLSTELPLNDDVIFSHCHAEDTITPHDLTASDSYTRVVDLGSSFYLSAAAHSYRGPCVRHASPASHPSWGHRRSSYDYLPVMSLSPPEDTEEDVTRVKAFKRHKSGNQDSQTENVNHSPPDMQPCPSYPGCAPCPAVCSPRPRYGTPPPPPPAPQWFMPGGGPGSSAPLPDLMFFDNSGHMWPKPPGYQPSGDWYNQSNPPQGWYAPVQFQMDMPPTVNNGAPVSTAPVSTANPLVQDLQLLASCLVPPPPPPSTPPSEHTPDTRQSEEKSTSGCYSTWPKTQPVAASYAARPPCRVFHYGAPSVRYETPSSSFGTSSGGTQNNVETTQTLPHHDDNLRNIRLRNQDSLAVINEAGSGVASRTTSNPTQPITSHEIADAVFSNYTLVNDGNQKQMADHEPSAAKSPTSQNDGRVVGSQYNGDDSLTDDSLMHHCADMAISMATTAENSQQGTAESRGKVKFRVAHYVPPTMRLSSSFSIVSAAESVSRMARSPKDVNMTLPCVGFSGSINSSPVVGGGPEGSNQQSTMPDKMRAIPRCSPYGPWQTTSTPVTQAEPSARTPDGTTEFTFQTPRRRSAPDIQMRRRLMNVDATSVTSPRGFSKNNSVTSLTGGALNNSHRGVSCTSVSSSVDSDLNLCGMGSSVESSPCTSQRVSRFSCCSVSSNNSQETWSELSVSFDDVMSPGKVNVADPVQCSKKEEGEIDWFDGECRPSTEKSHNRYEMFPEKRDTADGACPGSTVYGGSYGCELQANYTNPARNKWNLPPRMQRLLQESASASRAQSLMSKIQQPAAAYLETHGDHASSWQSLDWRSKLKEIFEKSSERFLDSHCHLDFLFDRVNFKGTFKKYVAMNELTFCNKFAGCVTVFCHPHTFTTEAGMWMDVLREDNVWGAVGCHPKCATNFTARAERAMKVMLRHDKMVAVGEIGLDYSGTFYQHQEAQKEVLARQLKLATEISKPIVIHSRESESDIISELEKHIPRNHKIHRHCFTGTWEEARTWLHKFPNSYIGLTALLTHRSRRAFPLKDVARYIPLDKLLIETDTPYFVPWRIPKTDMEFCHPGMVITVADEVARLKGIHIDVVLKASYENTRDMYGI